MVMRTSEQRSFVRAYPRGVYTSSAGVHVGGIVRRRPPCLLGAEGELNPGGSARARATSSGRASHRWLRRAEAKQKRDRHHLMVGEATELAVFRVHVCVFQPR